MLHDWQMFFNYNKISIGTLMTFNTLNIDFIGCEALFVSKITSHAVHFLNLQIFRHFHRLGYSILPNIPIFLAFLSPREVES